jgi:hypothetical protein
VVDVHFVGNRRLPGSDLGGSEEEAWNESHGKKLLILDSSNRSITDRKEKVNRLFHRGARNVERKREKPLDRAA